MGRMVDRAAALIAVMLAMLIAGCAMPAHRETSESDALERLEKYAAVAHGATTVASTPELYVALIPARLQGLDQPAQVDARELERRLRAIGVQSGWRVSAFAGEQILHDLAKRLTQAVDRASPEQEVLFAFLSGTSSFGPFSRRELTAGRLFADAGDIHVIVGVAGADPARYATSEADLRKLYREIRGTGSDRDWSLVSYTPQAARIAERGDRVRLPVAGLVVGGMVRRDSRPRLEEPVVPRRVADDSTRASHRAEIKADLEFLQQLRIEGLIDEEEYRVKREELLRRL